MEMRKIRIGFRWVGDDEPCFIIAEAGVNHNGDVETAKKLIDCATDAKADAVKFQTFRAETLASYFAPKAPYQEDTTGIKESQQTMLKRLELTRDDFKELIAYAEKKRITFLSSPFDEASVELLYSLGVPAFKVPSGEIVNHPLLEYIGSKRKPVFLSTGMASLGEIEEAVTVLRRAGCNEIILLHCVTSYPALIEESNLFAMQSMKCAFRIPVGFSDHTPGLSVPLAAVALGACVLEKHFTLNKALPGPDHRASLDPAELTALVRGVREVELAKGDGIKRLTPDEAKNVHIVRKSIVAARNIAKGEILREDMIVIKRPGTGIGPKYSKHVLGFTTMRPIVKDEPITWDAIRGKAGLR
jgi:N-acetylneuraminate synthase